MSLDPTELGRFQPVADTPGFVRAVGAALDVVRMAGLGPADIGALDDEYLDVRPDVVKAYPQDVGWRRSR